MNLILVIFPETRTTLYKHTQGLQQTHLKTDILAIRTVLTTITPTLFKHIWDLKNQGKRYDLEWESIDRAGPFNPTTRKCRLCQIEKYYILPEGATLNKRQELYNTCRHRLKDLLTNT